YKYSWLAISYHEVNKISEIWKIATAPRERKKLTKYCRLRIKTLILPANFVSMNIHEYQGKEILKRFGVRVQEGIVAETQAEAVEAAKKLKEDFNSDWVVIKAQIHAGGRGKGGGVKLAKNHDEVLQRATDIIGMQLITPQTGPEGKRVNKVLVAQDVYYPGESETKEFYMSVLLDRAKGRNIIMYSTEGGMDIVEVA